MAAPSGIVWGGIVGGYGRIGIYTSASQTSTTYKVTTQIWIWSKYSVSDTNNVLYYDNLSSAGSATTNKGAVSISTTVDTGSGWSTTNQKLIKTYTHSYTRTTSAVTRYLYAKLANIDRVGGTMYVNTSFTVPKLDSYKVTYNANGGTGAPGAQTKWYGKDLTLQSGKPTRTGHTFSHWVAGNGTRYNPGAVYTANAALALSAVWTANTYKVTFNANGGTGAPGAQTKTYGVTLKLSSTVPTRTNYNFLGWSTSKTATTATYKAGSNYTANSGTTLYAVWELAYVKPRITSFSVVRCNSSGTASDTGTYGLVKFNWACDRTVSSITITVNGSTTTVSATGTSGSVSQIIGGSLSSDKTYPVTVKVTDSVNSSQAEKPLNGTKFAIDIYAKGNGAAFGKPAEHAGWLDSLWPLLLRSGMRLSYGGSINGVTDTGEVLQTIEPYTSGGNLVIGRGLHNTKKGETYLQGYDVKISVSNAASNIDFRPYVRRGVSLSFSIRTAGYVTNSGKDVSFTVPFAVPIIGSPTVSITSGNGFTLRQDGKYTHGSSATVYCTPAKYEASISQYCGVYITAEFSDTTNVINNAPIGIYWNGTITFS